MNVKLGIFKAATRKFEATKMLSVKRILEISGKAKKLYNIGSHKKLTQDHSYTKLSSTNLFCPFSFIEKGAYYA